MNQPKETPPPYSPPTPAHYGSTSDSIPEASLFSIFVIQDGHSTSQAFSVKARATDTVDDLKKLIRTAKSPRFDNISADELKLASVCIPDDVHTEHKPRQLRDITLTRALRATEVLEDLFLGRLAERGRIHVVIETDEPKSDRADAASDQRQNRCAHSSDKIEMDERDTQISVQQQQQQQPRPQEPHTIVPLDSLAASPTQTPLALPSCPDQPAETNDLPYPVLPTTTSDPISSSSSSSYPALPVATLSSTNTEEILAYPLESLDTIEPLSNPLPLDPTTPLVLFCLVDGQSTKQTWSIKALPADTVDDMKKAVKAAEAPHYDHVAAGELHLRNNDPECDTIPVNINSVKYLELKAMDTVADVYPRGAVRKTVQLMVMKPGPKPYSSERGGSGCGACEVVLVVISLIMSIIAAASGNDMF
ncbi:hypothetical protein BG006_010608 [Podila minutissima]|uniref:Crinkler effector protein N-terminal domain-containing protein n=1 Tax=Podila minutissima TaxID=64525 RepID=A0A9P5SUG5_9FUNG|nr:hypothetical protein BG006_010608 [Podila minutissima]